MKKKQWKVKCDELQSQNLFLLRLAENSQSCRQNVAKDEETVAEEGNLDFFEKNARESNMIEAVKALTPDKEKEMELILKEIRLELKQQSKRLKAVERKAERCMSAREKEVKKIDSLGKSISEAECVSTRLRKKVKKQRKILKLVEQLFLVAAARGGEVIPGESFEQLAKRYIKNKSQVAPVIKWIDAK